MKANHKILWWAFYDHFCDKVDLSLLENHNPLLKPPTVPSLNPIFDGVAQQHSTAQGGPENDLFSISPGIFPAGHMQILPPPLSS
jgi:hypothetical protein